MQPEKDWLISSISIFPYKSMTIPAFYFDGKTSRRHVVTLSVQDKTAYVTGEIQRNASLAELRVSERFRNAPRKVTFPDGAYLEILDNDAFNALLRLTGHYDSIVVKLQHSWRGTLAAGLIVCAILVFGFRYGVPAFATAIAKVLPERATHVIGREALSFLEQRILQPTQLPAQRQKEIADRFAAMVSPHSDPPKYELIFRRSRIGPNALALPSGQIVLTDELVKLADDDDALMGVLSHELGHLHERHLMRRILQGSITGAVASVLFGDISSVVANIPTVMLDLKYSREAEQEADDYAAAMLKANGVSTSALIRMFEKLTLNTSAPPPYLSGHPSTAERIKRLRERQ